MSNAPARCELIVLDVDESGTIIARDVPEPRIRVDVFGSVSLRLEQSGEDIIDQIERCEPLVWQFRKLGRAHASELSQRHLLNEPVSALISGRRLSPSERLIFRALREDEDDGWLRWIEFSGDGFLEHFKSLIKHWLASNIDWAEVEYFDAGYNGQDMAKLTLQRLPRRVLKVLGVVIVDVTHDGSTCRAARLQKSVVQANEVANLFGLAVRFSQHGNREGASNSKAFAQEFLS